MVLTTNILFGKKTTNKPCIRVYASTYNVDFYITIIYMRIFRLMIPVYKYLIFVFKIIKVETQKTTSIF